MNDLMAFSFLYAVHSSSSSAQRVMNQVVARSSCFSVKRRRYCIRPWREKFSRFGQEDRQTDRTFSTAEAAGEEEEEEEERRKKEINEGTVNKQKGKSGQESRENPIQDDDAVAGRQAGRQQQSE